MNAWGQSYATVADRRASGRSQRVSCTAQRCLHDAPPTAHSVAADDRPTSAARRPQNTIPADDVTFTWHRAATMHWITEIAKQTDGWSHSRAVGTECVDASILCRTHKRILYVCTDALKQSTRKDHNSKPDFDRATLDCWHMKLFAASA